jgi:RNA polymerase sigma-70 factor (ECF subfamily)
MQKNHTEFDSRTDDQLVQLARLGDDTAFTELMNRHRSICFALASSILRDRSDAEDEVQNAIWKAYSHLDQFNHEAKFSTWLTRIVVNQCLMRLRKDRRAKFLYLDDAQIGEEVGRLDLPDTADTPEVDLGRREISQILHQEVNRMPPLLKKVFLMREIEERPMPDVAESLGISVAAAKSRLLRARAELKERLRKHQGRIGVATLAS